MQADMLRVGDVFLAFDVPVEVLREQEPWTDQFGREGFRYWCRRTDTNAEGWCPFGTGGFVLLANPERTTP